MDAEDVDDDTGSSETSEEEPPSLFSDASVEEVTEYNQPPAHDEVNKRAGHIAVQYGEGALVWGGYSEVPAYLEGHEYYLPSELWHYSYLKDTWKKLRTTGEVPNRCSGAGACLIDESLFVAAGYHQVFDRTTAIQEAMYEQLEVEISNKIWRLNLHNLTWKRLNPGGVPPLNCDKTSMWAYDKKAYLFGGFGPPARKDLHKDVERLFQYTEDSSLSDGYFGDIYTRGWSNQLVFYDEEKNKWIWPQYSGSPPSPRACHSSAVIRDKVYIFGGRHDELRLNDLYCLDMRSHTWTNILLPLDSPPIGRSWQSLTPLHTGKDAGALLLYGGFDNDSNTLGDCWKLDLDKDHPEWMRMKHLEQGTRLWHCSVPLNSSTHIIIGGITDNILSPSYVEKHHAEKVLFLEVNPKSLLASVLDYITKHKQEYSSQIQDLPHNLRLILEARISGNVITKDSNINMSPDNSNTETNNSIPLQLD